MKTSTRQAITRRMACCVGWVLVGGVVAGCSSSATGASHTVRDGQLVVTGSAPEARLRTVVRDARTAVDRVRKLWGSSVLTEPVHIEVPADDAGFRAAGGSAEPGAQIAATTTAAGRVVLAPALFSQVTGQGVVVVLTHELTHVALHQAGDSDIARWVVEGAAEFTAYRPTGLTLPRLAPQLAAAVRAGHVPIGPPSDARFRSAPQAAYQEAYAWCAFLVDRFGTTRFTGFVRSVHTGQLAEFAAAFGSSMRSLRPPFQQFLRTQVAADSTSSATGG
ncbi:hypothetical protein [Flexivirga alba]|uniref:Peptidase MA-like domain-containing protein n=1 Tax=Flexivirga alba TaxID=702742 RepID=A0ABW2AHZ0_9MICO